MPWIVKKDGKQFCVFKKGGGKIDGGCHNTRKEATNHMRALYANSKEFSEAAEGLLTMLRPLRFSESEVENGKLVKWIQAFPYGSWDHPIYGMSYFAKHNAETMKANFSEKVHGQEVLTTDFEHGYDASKGTKSSGTILDMDVREDGLWWLVEFTPTASKEIQDNEWTYFSPEYYEVYEDHMSGEIHADVATGGALTNKPWIKGMMPINLSEVLVEKGVLNRDDQTGEVAWEEHHDPDQDPHQQPKPEDPHSTEDRFPSPLPVQKEADEQSEQEASVEITAAMLTALGLPEDATEADVEAAITTAAAALTSTQADEEAAKQFSERFPEQHRLMTEQAEELARLRGKDAERDAEAFGKRFSQFTIKVANEDAEEDEDKEVEVVKGFSAVVCESLTDLHKKFSKGEATPDDLTPILEQIVSGNGIVEYGERGSSTDTDPADETDAANPQEAARMLSDFAQAAIVEAGGPEKLTWGDAMAKVAREHPALAKMYSTRKEG